MRGPLWSPQALNDLVRLSRWIARRGSPQGSRRVARSIRERAMFLAERPELGRLRPDIDPAVRTLAALSHVIIYEQTRAGVQILRVVHGSRDITSIWRHAPEIDGDPPPQ